MLIPSPSPLAMRGFGNMAENGSGGGSCGVNRKFAPLLARSLKPLETQTGARSPTPDAERAELQRTLDLGMAVNLVHGKTIADGDGSKRKVAMQWPPHRSGDYAIEVMEKAAAWTRARRKRQQEGDWPPMQQPPPLSSLPPSTHSASHLRPRQKKQ